MTDDCVYLEYRRESGDRAFETSRAYCTVTGSFVQPMRADVCNARYGLDPGTDCEFYVDPADELDAESDGDDSGATE